MFQELKSGLKNCALSAYLKPQLHPIVNDKAATFLDMAAIKGYSQMLLSDIIRVKG